MAQLLSRLSVAQKLLLICGIFCLPIGCLLFLTVSTLRNNLNTADTERAGVHVLLAIERSRGELLAQLESTRPSTDLASSLDDLARLLDAAAAGLSYSEFRLPSGAQGSRAMAELVALARGVSDGRSERGRTDLGLLSSGLDTLTTHVADHSGLVLDPDIDSYYLMDAAVIAATDTAAHLFQLRTIAGHADSEATRMRRVRLLGFLEEIDRGRLATSFATALQDDESSYGRSASLQDRLPPAIATFQAAMDALLKGLSSAASASTERTGSLEQSLELKALAAVHELKTIALQELDKLLALRMAAQRKDMYSEIGLTLLVLIAGMAMTAAIIRNLVSSVRQALGMVERVASNDLTVRLEVSSRDELGRMCTALNSMVRELNSKFSLIDDNTQALSEAAGTLEQTSRSLKTVSAATSNDSNHVAAAAEQINANVRSVASAGEQMQSSVREIGQTATQTAKVGEEAVAKAERATVQIGRLGDASHRISDITKLITALAEQTNLLALNATIEAARAGEAGKGFAVVASEVKDLAAQTTKATDQIRARISEIQNETAASVETIREISEVLQQLNKLQTMVAAAVEEQTAASAEIGRNITEAATGVGDITERMVHVSTSANACATDAERTAQMSTSLSSLAGKLGAVVSSVRLR